jgi:hypothetical protein
VFALVKYFHSNITFKSKAGYLSGVNYIGIVVILQGQNKLECLSLVLFFSTLIFVRYDT